MRTAKKLAAAVTLACALGALAGFALTPGPRPRRGTPIEQAPLATLWVTSPWGFRALGFHAGVDLRAAEGTPVRAVAPGVVAKARVTRRGGQSVVVDLDSGWRAGYAHLSRIDVDEGARVRRGQRLGLSGNTGRSSGPHLHFTLRTPSGRVVDPWPYLSGTAPSPAGATWVGVKRGASRTLWRAARTVRNLV